MGSFCRRSARHFSPNLLSQLLRTMGLQDLSREWSLPVLRIMTMRSPIQGGEVEGWSQELARSLKMAWPRWVSLIVLRSLYLMPSGPWALLLEVLEVLEWAWWMAGRVLLLGGRTWAGEETMRGERVLLVLGAWRR